MAFIYAGFNGVCYESQYAAIDAFYFTFPLLSGSGITHLTKLDVKNNVVSYTLVTTNPAFNTASNSVAVNGSFTFNYCYPSKHSDEFSIS